MKIDIFQITKVMKTLLACISFLCTVYIVNGQAPAIKSIIKGTIIDSIKNTPLAFATISLLDKRNNKLIKNTFSKENGSFEFDGLQNKQYFLQVVSVGFQLKTIPLPSFPKAGEPVFDAGTIPLTPTTAGTNEVVVTTTVKKPLITQEVDRISYDVQADPENSGKSVLDMLRKVPLVSVDATDKIMLKGSDSYKILINGQPSALIAQNPSDIFKAMPASNILRIEIITTPPAKYDAEGLAGIINIITKNKIGDGYNGNVSLQYNSIYGPRFNFNGTVKQGKFGMSGYIGVQIPQRQTVGNGYTNKITSPVKSYLTQQGTSITKNKNPYASIEVSYAIDSLNLITAIANGYQWISDQNNTQFSYDSATVLQQSYGLSNTIKNKYQGGDIGINYQLGFKRNKEQMLTASYRYHAEGSTNATNGNYTERFNDTMPNYIQNNNSGTKEHTIQLDYVHPLKKLTIEAGAKAILRNNYSDYNYNNYNSFSKSYVPDLSQTNNFNYQQNVFSIYNSYELKLDKFVVKAGLRLEHTIVNAGFASVDSSINESYNNFIPSISFQRKMKGNNSVNLGYTERIERPMIWQLNPFINKSNPQVINSGNPTLQPVLNHSFEINYINFKKGNTTIGLSYSFANNTIENITSVNMDTITQTTYQNVGKNKTLSLNINSNYPITKNFSFNMNAIFSRVWLKGTYNGDFYNQSGYQEHFFIGSNYNFPHDFHASINVGYESRYVLLQGLDNHYFFFGMGASKDIMKKKASISIYAMDPYAKYRKIDFYTTTATFNQYNYFYQYARRFNITFRYKFGYLNSDIKKSEKVINNDDVNQQRGHD